MDALTTHQLQVERRERVIEPIKCMRSPHTSYRWRGERVIEPIKCMRSPTPATGGEEEQRGVIEDNQAYAPHQQQLQVKRREDES